MGRARKAQSEVFAILCTHGVHKGKYVSSWHHGPLFNGDRTSARRYDCRYDADMDAMSARQQGTPCEVVTL